MNKSESVTDLSAALAKAQAGIANAAKEGINPHFNRSYATLKSVWEVCKTPLTDNGLSVVQSPEVEAQAVKVTTTLLHKSGQWIESSITMPVQKWDCQGIGSAITYARRYALAAMVGVAPSDDDDDGESAVNHHQKTQPPQNPQGNQQQLTQNEKTDYQKVNSFLKAAGCDSKETAELVLDLIAPGQTVETIKNEEIASFVLSELKTKLGQGVFKPETALQVARSTKAAIDAF
ncbi:MAG: ERF family protein [Planctomycetota bacterium]